MTFRDNPEIAKKYHCKKWRNLRNQKLLLVNYLCERCIKKNKYKSAYIVHHKEYVTDKNYMNDNIFYNINNLEAVCIECHNKEHFKEKEEYYFDEEGNLVYEGSD